VDERDKDFPLVALLARDIVTHRGITPRKALLLFEPLPDPPRRLPLVLRHLPVGFQYGINNPPIRPQFGRARGTPPIPRRERKLKHLMDRGALDAKSPRCGAFTLPIDYHRPPHFRVQVHTIHPFYVRLGNLSCQGHMW
jgi:hypothetical protein